MPRIVALLLFLSFRVAHSSHGNGGIGFGQRRKVSFDKVGNSECHLEYTLFRNTYLRGATSKYHQRHGVASLSECEKLCCQQDGFECKSFSYFQTMKVCYVMNVSREDDGVRLRRQQGWIHGDVFNRTSGDCQYASTVDLLFLLDGSGSVRGNFSKVKEWVKAFTYSLDIDDKLVSVGVVQYSHYDGKRDITNQKFIKTEIEIGEYTTHENFVNAVDQIELQGYTTYTGMALRKVAFDFNSTRNYGKDFNSQILILVTDGKATDPENIPESTKNLRDMGVITYVVGIMSVEVESLRMIATGDNSTDDRVFYVDNFDSLDSITSEIQSSSNVCKWLNEKNESLPELEKFDSVLKKSTA